MIRRWAWRAALGCLALVTMLGAVVGVNVFNRACDGSLEGLRYLANVRAQLAAATAPPPTPRPAQPQAAPAQPPPTPIPPTPVPATTVLAQRAREAAGVAGDAALVALIAVKQSDLVAYPAHIAAAHTLSLAGCGTDAIRLQWLKAGLHASRSGQPEYIAAALRASADDQADLADLREVVRVWTERSSQSVSLRQVLSALDDDRS